MYLRPHPVSTAISNLVCYVRWKLMAQRGRDAECDSPAHSSADGRLYTRHIPRRTRCSLPALCNSWRHRKRFVRPRCCACAVRTPPHGYLPETRNQPPRPRRFHIHTNRRKSGMARPSRAAGQPSCPVASTEDGCLCEDRRNVEP